MHRALCDLLWEVTSQSQGTCESSASQQPRFEIMLNDKCASFLPHHFTSQLLEEQESLLVLAQCNRSYCLSSSPCQRKGENKSICTYRLRQPSPVHQCHNQYTGPCQDRFHTELERKLTLQFIASTWIRRILRILDCYKSCFVCLLPHK